MSTSGRFVAKPFCGLYNIQHIRKYLTPVSTKTLVHAFVTSHLDYCNSPLFGLPKYHLDRLQKILNAAARLIHQIPTFDHITPTLVNLHWLHEALNDKAPEYIKDLLCHKPNLRFSFCSCDQALLSVPRAKCTKLGDSAFSRLGPFYRTICP